MNMLPIEEIIDLERYPIHQSGSARYSEILTQGQAALAENALFTMPGFVRSGVIARMADELNVLLPQSVRYEQLRCAYDDVPEASGWPDEHPRQQLHACAYNQILNYQIPNDALVREIYCWQPLTEFLQLLCGYETFYRVECPYLALTSKIARAGDTDGWHYDSNDVVFSLLLQAPEAGGQFEYAPGIRTQGHENYEAVTGLFADPARCALRPSMSEGDFNVFQGDLSMHRVTPVEGLRNRIVALFCYDQWYIDQLKQGLPKPSC